MRTLTIATLALAGIMLSTAAKIARTLTPTLRKGKVPPSQWPCRKKQLKKKLAGEQKQITQQWKAPKFQLTFFGTLTVVSFILDHGAPATLLLLCIVFILLRMMNK